MPVNEMKKLLMIPFSFLTVLLCGQTESIVIQWGEDHGELTFPGALYEDRNISLPYYSINIPWEDRGKVPVFETDVIRSSPVTGTELGYPYPIRAAEKPVLSWSPSPNIDDNTLILKILPLLRMDGSLEKVEEMNLQLSWKSAIAPLKSTSVATWKENSVLAQGNWFRISVEESGMHRLSYEQLQEIGLENPALVQVFGSGARLLPEKYSLGHMDDLESVPLYLHKGSDNLFGPGDHILFYAQGPVSWSYDETSSMFAHHLHDYSLKGYYFLSDGQGPAGAPENAQVSLETPTHELSSYDYRDWYEEEEYNLINSGREWYGEYFNVNLEYSFPFRIPNPVAGKQASAMVVVAARSGESSDFQVEAQGTLLGSISLQGTFLGEYTANFAYENRGFWSFDVPGENIVLTLNYLRPDVNSEGWLNRISINARSELSMQGINQLLFRDMESTGAGSVVRYNLGSAGSAVVWDITDPSVPLNIPLTMSGQDASFTLPQQELREFIAFKPAESFPSPEYEGESLGRISNQNLHGLDHTSLVIITPEEFLEQAERLAQYREETDGLETEVVLQQEVFNEFSSGTPDVTAIRNFMKMFFDRSEGSGDLCRYLLLFGDGSYDNRGRDDQKDNPNLILTYQSKNSLDPVYSFVSDDYFGILDTDANMNSGMVRIGIGRLPASTAEEAERLVDKIISYQEDSERGGWRNQLCFIGDDQDGNLHMRQADELARYVQNNYPAYNLNKVFLDAYVQEKTSTGFRYPDVNRTINNQVNRGALVVNYTGHGGPSGLAHEQVVTTNDILSWSNSNMLPLFMTATCEFSRYDEYDRALDQEQTSAGEEVMLSTQGGGIGLFTTTRLVYAGPNHRLNEKFFEVVFEKDSSGKHYRLGDIIRYSKNNTEAGYNKRNFTLLGDPSVTLLYPGNLVITDSINHYEVPLTEDTLSAFDWVSISGHLETTDGTLLEDFQGTVQPIVFDKEKRVETLSNDGGSVFDFMARNNNLYSGKASVVNGRFNFSFFVPKDINYSIGPGKISYYGFNEQTDAHGSFDEFKVGGIGKENSVDSQPPDLEIFMNDSFFMDGGITDPDPTLLVYARDNYGINTTGNGIGHDLTAILDGNRVEAAILNEFFQADYNSHNSGTIHYPYSKLEKGHHEVTVKIWDIHNNSTEVSLEFLVVDSESMLIEKLFNYPNPFMEQTLFHIEHNRPDSEMNLKIQIFDMSGNLLRSFDKQVHPGGYTLEPPSWDGSSSGGTKLGAGMYLYRVTLTTTEGEVATESGKMIMVR